MDNISRQSPTGFGIDNYCSSVYVYVLLQSGAAIRHWEVAMNVDNNI